jgi:hypothetical protein
MIQQVIEYLAFIISNLFGSISLPRPDESSIFPEANGQLLFGYLFEGVIIFFRKTSDHPKLGLQRAALKIIGGKYRGCSKLQKYYDISE